MNSASTAHAGPPRSRWREPDMWISHTLLALLVVVWILLATSLPSATNRRLTIDISCTSGNAIVGVWIQASSGGSGWAERGVPGAETATRFTYHLAFDGDYEIRVGCGGTAQVWGVESRSALGSAGYRRILCDDLDYAPPAPARCRDLGRV